MGSRILVQRLSLLGGNKCTIPMEVFPCSEVVLFLEVTNVLSLWEVEFPCSEVVLFLEVTNALSLWEVEFPCSEVVLFLEVTNVLSLLVQRLSSLRVHYWR